jgi:hypothetical protein
MRDVFYQKRRGLLLIQQSLNIFEQLPTLIGKAQPQPCIGKRLAWQTDNIEINVPNSCRVPLGEVCAQIEWRRIGEYGCPEKLVNLKGPTVLKGSGGI